MTNESLGQKRREQMLEAIVGFMLEKGYPPSVREIGKMVGLSSTSSVNAHLRRMAETGMINMEIDQPRTITVPNVRYVDERR